MIPKIKTALFGDDPRTDSGWIYPTPNVADDDTRPGPDVSETDPFRPAIDFADGEDYYHVEMDQVFGILRNQRRRYVLKYLSMTEGTITLADLTERIAAWESGKAIEQVTAEERRQVYVSLYQCHLPKMAAASAITYHEQRDEIEAGELFPVFSHYLRRE